MAEGSAPAARASRGSGVVGSVEKSPEQRRKDEALHLGSLMAQKRTSQVASGGDRTSQRSSKRDSAFEGVSGGAPKETAEVSERALTREFRALADVFNEEKKATQREKREKLERYEEVLASHTKTLQETEKGKQLLKEHTEVVEEYKKML